MQHRRQSAKNRGAVIIFKKIAEKKLANDKWLRLMIDVIINRILTQVNSNLLVGCTDKESTYMERVFIGDDITCHVTCVRTIQLPEFQLLKLKNRSFWHFFTRLFLLLS